MSWEAAQRYENWLIDNIMAGTLPDRSMESPLSSPFPQFVYESCTPAPSQPVVDCHGVHDYIRHEFYDSSTSKKCRRCGRTEHRPSRHLQEGYVWSLTNGKGGDGDTKEVRELHNLIMGAVRSNLPWDCREKHREIVDELTMAAWEELLRNPKFAQASSEMRRRMASRRGKWTTLNWRKREKDGRKYELPESQTDWEAKGIVKPVMPWDEQTAPVEENKLERVQFLAILKKANPKQWRFVEWYLAHKHQDGNRFTPAQTQRYFRIMQKFRKQANLKIKP